MRELSDHLRVYADMGVTHLNLPKPGSEALGPSLGLSGERSQPAQSPVSRRRASPAGGAEEVPPAEGGGQRPASDPGQEYSIPELPEGSLGLGRIRRLLGDCRRCPLSRTRTQIVFGVGNPEADLMFVGEAPGADEDEVGLPFVGAAGQLLSKIILAIGLYRDQVYVANILKCRPPGNRDPLPQEVACCSPFLFKQVEAVQPKVVVALGRYAAQSLLQTETAISALRGKFFDLRGRPLMPTFHPSYLLRNPGAKRQVWEDMKAVREKLVELGSVYYADGSG